MNSAFTRMAKLLAATVSLLLSTAAPAYEIDVHYGLTRWLALQAGFTEADAEILATSDRKLDGNFLDAIPRVVRSACLLRADEFGANKVRENHFATEVTVPNPPSARAVKPGSEFAFTRAADRIERPLPGRAANLMEFGERLHALQDTWSHKGVPDVPALWPFKCRGDYAWGHSAAWGGWSSHLADITVARPPDAMQMAEATFGMLCRYRKEVDKVPCPHSWKSFEPAVGQFSALKTQQGKREWFAKRGFKDVGFIQGTSLPESDNPVPPFPYLLIPPYSSLNAIPKDEIHQFFAKFLGWWALTKSFESLPTELLDTESFGVDSKADRLLPANPELTRLTLKFWRARDHGRVALRGHQLAELDAAARAELARSLEVPGMLDPYREAAEAYLPANEAGAPFVLLTAPSPRGGETFLAMLRFRHAPNDAVIVSAERSTKGLRVNAIQSLIEH